jgi:hypothetical protein
MHILPELVALSSLLPRRQDIHSRVFRSALVSKEVSGARPFFEKDVDR